MGTICSRMSFSCDFLSLRDNSSFVGESETNTVSSFYFYFQKTCNLLLARWIELFVRSLSYGKFRILAAFAKVGNFDTGFFSSIDNCTMKTRRGNNRGMHVCRRVVSNNKVDDTTTGSLSHTLKSSTTGSKIETLSSCLQAARGSWRSPCIVDRALLQGVGGSWRWSMWT